ncbi:MAG: hypothetical protein Q9226_005959 [Calogaya cf. arnoldii]
MTTPYNPTKTALTARETELIVLAIQCQEGDIKINYEKFAKIADYDKKKSACTILGQLIKHKITASTVDSFSVACSAGGGAKRAGPKAAKASKPEGQGQGENNEVVGDGEGEGEEKVTKGKGSPRKRAAKGQGDGGSGNGKRAKKSSIKVEEDEVNGVEAVDGAKIVKQEGEEGFFEAATEGHGDGVEV